MPSQTIEIMIELVPALPEATVRDLLDLFRYDLAHEHLSADRPASRLGLLAVLLVQWGGEVPSVIAYDEDRRRDSENWPPGSQLAREYGGWVRAVRAAGMLAAGDSPPARNHHPVGGFYSQHEAFLALAKSREQIGAWPATRSEYARWANVARAIENRWGSQPARVPSAETLSRLFGDFETAVRLAQRWLRGSQPEVTTGGFE